MAKRLALVTLTLRAWVRVKFDLTTGTRHTCPIETLTARRYHGSQLSWLSNTASAPNAEAERTMPPRLAASPVRSIANSRIEPRHDGD